MCRVQVYDRHIIVYTYVLCMPVAHICTYRDHVSAIRPAGRCAGAKRHSKAIDHVHVTPRACARGARVNHSVGEAV